MKKNISFKYLLVAGICSAVVFTGCRKETVADKLTTEAANNGKSFVGFPNGMETTTFFDPFTNIKTADVFVIKKDAKSNAELMKANNFVVTLLPDAVDKYNENHNKSYELLPSSFYTAVASPDLTVTPSSYTFKFAGGDFQKTLAIKIDGSKLDLSKTYVLPFKLTNADGVDIHAASKDTLYAIYAIKNAYDGKYTVSGSITRFTGGGQTDNTLGGTYVDDVNITIATIGKYANSIALLWADGKTTVGGVDGLNLVVDPATNKVVVSATGNAALKNTPGEDNYYDPATKTFHLAFSWGADADHQRVFKASLKYSGSR